MRSSQTDLTIDPKTAALWKVGRQVGLAILAILDCITEVKTFQLLYAKLFDFAGKEDESMDARIVEAVGRMHVARITGQMLAKESGYNASYVSEILNGRRGTEKALQSILDALSRLEVKQAEQREAQD